MEPGRGKDMGIIRRGGGRGAGRVRGKDGGRQDPAETVRGASDCLQRGQDNADFLPGRGDTLRWEKQLGD